MTTKHPECPDASASDRLPLHPLLRQEPDEEEDEEDDDEDGEEDETDDGYSE
jgi:hypothetical protein